MVGVADNAHEERRHLVIMLDTVKPLPGQGDILPGYIRLLDLIKAVSDLDGCWHGCSCFMDHLGVWIHKIVTRFKGSITIQQSSFVQTFAGHSLEINNGVFVDGAV